MPKGLKVVNEEKKRKKKKKKKQAPILTPPYVNPG
jgi:hypothetical protein